MTKPNVHCKLDEKIMSLTVFLTRFVTASTLLYTCIGCLLYYREFLYNAAAIGITMPVQVGIGVVVAEMLISLFLLLGWFTRWAAGAAVLNTILLAGIFFASDFNKLYVALLVLLASSLLPAVLLGPGRYSLDFIHARRRAEQAFRG